MTLETTPCNCPRDSEAFILVLDLGQSCPCNSKFGMCSIAQLVIVSVNSAKVHLNL